MQSLELNLFSLHSKFCHFPNARLDSDAKYAEIGRLLPLVSGVAADFSLTQQTIGIASIYQDNKLLLLLQIGIASI